MYKKKSDIYLLVHFFVENLLCLLKMLKLDIKFSNLILTEIILQFTDGKSPTRNRRTPKAKLTSNNRSSRRRNLETFTRKRRRNNKNRETQLGTRRES
jgi:hypothetical protein